MLIPGGRDRHRIDALLHPTVCFVPQQRVQMPELQHVTATAGPSCLGLVTQQVSRWTQLRCCGAAQTSICACTTTVSSPRSAAVRHSSPVRQTLAPAVGERCFSLFQPPVTHAELVLCIVHCDSSSCRLLFGPASAPSLFYHIAVSPRLGVCEMHDPLSYRQRAVRTAAMQRICHPNIGSGLVAGEMWPG